jgi:hypothetical protein
MMRRYVPTASSMIDLVATGVLATQVAPSLGRALLTLLLLALVPPMPFSLSAGTVPAPPANRGHNVGGDDKDDQGHKHEDDSDDRNDKAGADPCRKALERAAKGKPLPQQCEPGGSGGAAKGDFNNDGFADLAVGVPFEDQDLLNAVGGVNIIYGSATGLTAASDQFLDALTFGLAYAADDHFGRALASGDFNGDDFSDLAIGVPDRDIGDDVDVGLVLLIDGGPSGLDTNTARSLPITTLFTRAQDRIGAALVWADFNNDQFGDLAVGIPGANVFARVGSIFSTPPFPSAPTCMPVLQTPNAGEVQVFYGGTNGLTQVGALLFQGPKTCNPASGVGEGGQESDRFGVSLAAGDFNDDSYADLVIGVPFEQSSANAGGLVHLVPGGSAGLRSEDARTLSQDSKDIMGTAEAGDQFGRSLAAGDFNEDGHADLAVGVPFENLGSEADAGAVQVFFGSTGAELVDEASDQFISQSDLAGDREAGDLFGFALAVGRFNSGGTADLAIGVPGKDIDGVADAGLVHVLYGSRSGGPSITNFQTWHQNTADVPEDNEEGDRFGFTLSAWDYDGNSLGDLAIGIPFEGIGTNEDAGAVVVIYGNLAGLSATGTPADLWHQSVSGINDAAQPGDRFGLALY